MLKTVQTAWIRNLDNLNFLAAYELLMDLQQEFNIATDNQVTIPLWNQIIKFPQLHPGDAPGIRDRYMERRFKVTNFLQTKGLIRNFEVIEGSHRWDNVIAITADAQVVEQAFQLVFAEYQRRMDAEKTNKSTSVSTNETKPQAGTPAVTYNVIGSNARVNINSHDDPIAIAEERQIKSHNRLTRGERIALIGLLVSLIGLPAAWLAVPGFQDWVKVHVWNSLATPTKK